jgi:hypothetical protein
MTQIERVKQLDRHARQSAHIGLLISLALRKKDVARSLGAQRSAARRASRDTDDANCRGLDQRHASTWRSRRRPAGTGRRPAAAAAEAEAEASRASWQAGLALQKRTGPTSPGFIHPACSVGWWLALVSSERRVLLAGCWWLVCSERKILLAGG